jgi:hypothetical protein
MHLKYLVVVMALIIGAFVIIATNVPGGPDRNVPGSTTGSGKTSSTD